MSRLRLAGSETVFTGFITTGYQAGLVLQVVGTLLTGRSSKSYSKAELLFCTESGCWSGHPESVLSQSGRTGAGHLI
jgi:hypothetical protein